MPCHASNQSYLTGARLLGKGAVMSAPARQSGLFPPARPSGNRLRRVVFHRIAWLSPSSLQFRILIPRCTTPGVTVREETILTLAYTHL